MQSKTPDSRNHEYHHFLSPIKHLKRFAEHTDRPCGNWMFVVAGWRLPIGADHVLKNEAHLLPHANLYELNPLRSVREEAKE